MQRTLSAKTIHAYGSINYTGKKYTRFSFAVPYMGTWTTTTQRAHSRKHNKIAKQIPPIVRAHLNIV